MRSAALAVSLLFVTTQGNAQTLQPEPMEAYAPLRAVGISLGTQQVLLWDEVVGEYRLAKVGEEVEHWRIVAVDMEARRIVVVKDGARDDLPLTEAPKAITLFAPRALALPSVAVAPAAVPPTPPALQPAPPPPVKPATTTPVLVTPAPAPVAPPAAQPKAAATPAPAARVQEERHPVSRAELDRELNDFDRLLAGVAVVAAPGGGFILTRLDPKSWVASLGLHQNDAVRTVAGEGVSTVEDAARVYARITSLKDFAIEIDRGGQRVLLRIEVR